jgi:hypothetical protein
MKPVIYLAHPVRGDSKEEVVANLQNAKEWLRFLFDNAPDVAVIAPWIAEVEAMMEVGRDVDASVLDKALDDDVAVVSKCDGLLLVGGKISAGMQIEKVAAKLLGVCVSDLSYIRNPKDVAPNSVRTSRRSVSFSPLN